MMHHAQINNTTGMRMPRPSKIRLGEVLLQQNLISEDQLKVALNTQKRSRQRLGRIFAESGFVSEEKIAEALARQLKLPYIDLKFYDINLELARKLPEARARRFRALILEERGPALLVAMADPTDISAYDEIARVLKRDIEIAVVTEKPLLETVDRVYRRTEQISELARKLGKELGDTTDLGFGAQGAAPSPEEVPVIKLLQSMLEDATQVRASDVHIEPQETTLRIRFRIDGILHLQTEVSKKIAPALVLRLKLMSEMDISEKRLPQDGRFNVRIRQSPIDVRISTMPTQQGEAVVLRLLDQSGGLLGLEKLGMPPKTYERFHSIIRRPSGMVLVTGPTGSGKTTTLYATLAEISREANNVITLEDPVEYRLPGISQVQVNEKAGLTFSRVLRSALRHDPDVILLGEIRDADTAQIALRAAMTGHLLLSTLHTNDATSTPVRLLDMGVPRYMVASSLQAIVAQRLLRNICESCIEPHQLTPEEREWLKLELEDKVDNNRFMHGRGCSHCSGTGYRGRTGVYEMLEMTGALVEAINRQDPVDFIRMARDHMKGRTMRSHAVHLAMAGKTTVADAIRVSSQIED
jgi:MSHA biogenesis protein MshE